MRDSLSYCDLKKKRLYWYITKIEDADARFNVKCLIAFWSILHYSMFLDQLNKLHVHSFSFYRKLHSSKGIDQLFDKERKKDLSIEKDEHLRNRQILKC